MAVGTSFKDAAAADWLVVEGRFVGIGRLYLDGARQIVGEVVAHIAVELIVQNIEAGDIVGHLDCQRGRLAHTAGRIARLVVNLGRHGAGALAYGHPSAGGILAHHAGVRRFPFGVFIGGLVGVVVAHLQRSGQHIAQCAGVAFGHFIRLIARIDAQAADVVRLSFHGDDTTARIKATARIVDIDFVGTCSRWIKMVSAETIVIQAVGAWRYVPYQIAWNGAV